MRFLENAHLSLLFSQRGGEGQHTRASPKRERERGGGGGGGYFYPKAKGAKGFFFSGYRVLPKIALIPKKGPSSSFVKGGSPR